MFFLLFHDFFRPFWWLARVWAGAGSSPGSSAGRPGCRGGAEKCAKITKKQIFQKVVFRLEMDGNGYLVMF